METRRRQDGPMWCVIQNGGTKASNLRCWPRTLCCRTSSSTMSGCSMWGRTAPSCVFSFRSISKYRSVLTFVPVGMISECAKPLMFQKMSGWLYQQTTTLNFVGARDPLWRNSSSQTTSHSPTNIDWRHVFCSQTQHVIIASLFIHTACLILTIQSSLVAEIYNSALRCGKA